MPWKVQRTRTGNRIVAAGPAAIFCASKIIGMTFGTAVMDCDDPSIALGRVRISRHELRLVQRSACGAIPDFLRAGG